MADASKLKNKFRHRNSLGTPPGPDEVSAGIRSPEIAPAGVIVETVSAGDGERETESSEQVVSHAAPYVRRDGRSARKTHRIIAFATRVTPEFDAEIRDIADREGLKLVEVLEKALTAYKIQQGY